MQTGDLHGREYLGIAEGGEVEVDGERNCAINLAEAAAHVLLESLHVHSQQRGTPAQATATTQTWMPMRPRQKSTDTMKPILSSCKVEFSCRSGVIVYINKLSLSYGA